MIDLSTWLQGFVLGLGVFICPGPKDVLILREALSGRSPAQLIAVGCGSDAVLIALGLLGLSAALQAEPALRLAAQVLGIALLVLHGGLAVRNAMRACPAASLNAVAAAASGSHGLFQLLFVSLLNPAAWLDTVLIIGAVGAALPAETHWSYATGAVSASLVWFSVWVLGARKAQRFMGASSACRALDASIALAMWGMALWMSWDLW
jgi:L-lysine exporter family protein LysE/ArgO